MRSVAFITSGYYPLYVCYAMENCLDLAIRTEGVVGNVAPTIDKNATCCTLGIHAEYVLGLLRGAWWTFVSYRRILSDFSLIIPPPHFVNSTLQNKDFLHFFR